MRTEDPGQQPDREEGGGTGVSSSRGGVGGEPSPDPSASSGSGEQLPREQSCDVDMGDLGTEKKRR